MNALFFYSQYHSWIAEREPNGFKGFYLFEQVALISHLRSAPQFSKVLLQNWTFKAIFISVSLLRGLSGLPTHLLGRHLSDRQNNCLNRFNRQFDACSHLLYQAATVAILGTLLYQTALTSPLSILAGSVMIIADRLIFGSVPLTKKSPEEDNPPFSLSHAVKWATRIDLIIFNGLFLLLPQNTLISSTIWGITLFSDAFCNFIYEEAERRRRNLRDLMALQTMHERIREQIRALLRNFQEELIMETPQIKVAANHYVSGVEDLLKTLDSALAKSDFPAQDRQTMVDLKENLSVTGYMLFGQFAAISEALSENEPPLFEESYGLDSARQKNMEELRAQLKQIEVEQLKMSLLLSKGSEFPKIREKICQVYGIYTGSYSVTPPNPVHLHVIGTASKRFDPLLNC